MNIREILYVFANQNTLFIDLKRNPNKCEFILHIQLYKMELEGICFIVNFETIACPESS